MLPDLLARVARQDERERAAADAEVALRLLVERDERLLDLLRSAELPPDTLRLVADHLAGDRAARRPAAPVERRLGFPEGARSLLNHLDRRVPELRDTVVALLDNLSTVLREREDIERALAATPGEADIAAVLDRLKAAPGTWPCSPTRPSASTRPSKTARATSSRSSRSCAACGKVTWLGSSRTKTGSAWSAWPGRSARRCRSS
jgi:hypothetical protein